MPPPRRVDISRFFVEAPAKPKLVLLGDSGADGMAKLLSLRGYTVVRRDDGELPDAYLVVGEASIEQAAKLKADDATALIPVVGVGAAGAALAAIKAGFDHWFAEPVPEDQLLARLEVLLAASTKARGIAARTDALVVWRDWVRYFVHDLRSPLGVALMSIGFVRDAPGLTGEDREALVDAARELDRAKIMLQDLLDADRLRHGALVPRREPLDLEMVVRQVIDSARSSVHDPPPLRLVVNGDATFDGDDGLLRRVTTNLLNNALRHASGKPIDLTVEGSLTSVTLRVKNQGPAVGEAIRGHIFDPWAPAAKGASTGTGLGLAFARMAVEAHGGTIWLESPDEGNVVFALEIPRAVA